MFSGAITAMVTPRPVAMPCRSASRHSEADGWVANSGSPRAPLCSVS